MENDSQENVHHCRHYDLNGMYRKMYHLFWLVYEYMSFMLHVLSWDDDWWSFQHSGNHPVLASVETNDFSKSIISSEIIQYSLDMFFQQIRYLVWKRLVPRNPLVYHDVPSSTVPQNMLGLHASSRQTLIFTIVAPVVKSIRYPYVVRNPVVKSNNKIHEHQFS